jgi:pyruvate dehydrogenase E1 component beta subunit
VSVVTYREALRQGLYDAFERDERVFLMGEDVGRYGGTYAVSKGMLEKYGPERVRDTPLSELGFVGAGIGAALGGMRPIVEVMTVNFSLLALDQIVNGAAMLRHMSGGQLGPPVVIRMSSGAGRQLAAQHSNALEAWYAHVPGLKVIAPATIDDARGMVLAALDDGNPVVVFEYPALFETKGELSDEPVDIASAKVRRKGDRATLVTYGACLYKTLEAAEEVDGEVIDLRVLRPLDLTPVLESIRRTRRAVVVDEGWKSGSLAAEVMARIVEQAFYDLDAPLARVCREEVPIPYPKHLEEAALPQRERIVAAVKGLFG